MFQAGEVSTRRKAGEGSWVVTLGRSENLMMAEGWGAPPCAQNTKKADVTVPKFQEER